MPAQNSGTESNPNGHSWVSIRQAKNHESNRGNGTSLGRLFLAAGVAFGVDSLIYLAMQGSGVIDKLRESGPGAPGGAIAGLLVLGLLATCGIYARLNGPE